MTTLPVPDAQADPLVERLAMLLLPPLDSHVVEWPPELQELHRAPGWPSFSVRAAAVDLERRRIDVRTILRQLRAEGWAPAEDPHAIADGADRLAAMLDEETPDV